MGLRELNAARTRALIADAAYALFAEQGYEETTMEQVADRADVGSSTLYRYFPTKESLALAPLGEPGVMAAEVARRPVGEPVDEVLGHAVLALVADSDEAGRRDDASGGRGQPAPQRRPARLAQQGVRAAGRRPRGAHGAPGRRRSAGRLRRGWRSSCSNGSARSGSRAAAGLSPEAAARRVMRDLAAAPLITPRVPTP